MKSIEMVEEFHRAFKHGIGTEPQIPNQGLCALRYSLLKEELDELASAFMARDLVGVLDALTDLQYVLDGTYLACGLQDYKDKALAEVHRSNMSKLGANGKPIYREDGKILKGPDYSPPDLLSVLDGPDLIDD